MALPILERYRELVLPNDETRAKLLAISPATIDRLLAPTRRRFWDKGRSSTKPGTLLKHHIPIRTYEEWNEKTPGFLEIDLVAHDGGSAYGDFIQSLDATDIASGWTETRAVRSKKFARIGQSTVIDGGFSPDAWLRHRKFKKLLQAKPTVHNHRQRRWFSMSE